MHDFCSIFTIMQNGDNDYKVILKEITQKTLQA